MNKLIITVAPTGAEVTKEMQPNLPITPEEIAKSCIDAYNVGACVCHIHVREDDGKPSSDIEKFKKVKELIEDKTDMIVQFSTGGSVDMTFEQRSKHLDLKPEMASLNVGSVNFGNEVFLNPLPFIKQLAEKMKKLSIKPEFEIYDTGMVLTAKYLIEKGYVDKPADFGFVMGVKGGMQPSIDTLVHLLKMLPEGSLWNLIAIGKWQLPLMTHAIVLGGNVRVGFEDNIYYKKGELAKSNAQFVERVVKIANLVGRDIATPSEAREILNIN